MSAFLAPAVTGGRSYLAPALAPAIIPDPPPGSTVTGVTVIPGNTTIASGGSQTFLATVVGTNSPSQAVTWSATLGSVTSGGVVSGPAGNGVVTATSTQNPGKSGTASYTILAAPIVDDPNAPIFALTTIMRATTTNRTAALDAAPLNLTASLL